MMVYIEFIPHEVMRCDYFVSPIFMLHVYFLF